MAITPSPDDNLIHGLSDFWVTFFRDSDRLRDVYEAQAVQYGQLYLDLLDAVLGVSLEHVPLFSRRYFKDFYVREDELIFSEGASPADDRWLHVSEDKLAGVAWLMNRVVAPTCVVEPGRDYVITEGAVAFTVDPFSSERYAPFPVRTIDVSYPAAVKASWPGVRAGDTARFTPLGGRPVYARVRGVRDDALLLDRYLPEFGSASGGTLSVLRSPYDAVKAGVQITPQPVQVTTIDVEPVGASKKLNVTGADGSWVGTYVAVRDSSVPSNSGFHRVNSVGPGYVLVDAPGDFLSSPTQPAYRVDLGDDYGASPSGALENTSVREGTLVVYGRSADGDGLEAGVDYVADLSAGTLRFVSAWDAASTATASYEWDLVVAETSVSGPSEFKRDYVTQTREMALWGADVRVDRDVLYENFGYLLGFRRETSEQYRAFLKGVSQLYLLGSNASRFESALNVMAGYPVVREDGERLVSYDDGVVSSGTGSVLDFREGRDGALASGPSTFTSASAGFAAGDEGAVVTVRSGSSTIRYTVTAVLSPTSATVSPTPTNATDVEWSYRHVASRGRFVSSAPAFSSQDVGSNLVIAGALNARNNGAFRIAAIEGPNVAVLESPFGFADEGGLAWRVTKTRQVRVVTDRRTYVLPFGTPMREDVAAGSGVTFSAYEALTEAFEVVSEQIDPTWWHRAYIPPDVLEEGEPARRYVSPLLVEHTFGAVDGPRFGDPDFYFGLDDEGQPPAAREGAGVWLGGQWVTAPEPLTPRDVGRYAIVKTAPFEGSFKIEGVLDDNVTMKLERFPPPEAAGRTPPASVTVRLPAILYRRPVAFVMMDRFLKRHAIAVRVHPDAKATPEFMADAAQLVREARPSHAFVYMESLARMEDRLSLSETFHATIKAGLSDEVAVVDTRWAWHPDSFVSYGDAYTYVEHTFAITYPGGTYTTTLTPPAPYSAPFKYVFLDGRFTDATATVSGHTRDLAEGADYTFDRSTGLLKITRGDPGTIHIATLSCFLRSRAPGDALLGYETRVYFGGNDPSVNAPGLADRAISIRLS